MPALVITWIVCACAVAGVLLRPARIPEWVWAVGGALLLVAAGLVPSSDALGAVASGGAVYAFLLGMMLLAEVAREQGVFAWLAAHAVRAAGGSQERLFALLFCVGVAVTVLLSNDATAVVLTPAVVAVAARARVSVLPYALLCAFVANAASFVLPISNPANLVVYGGALPHLGAWLATFALPSLAAIAATYVTLRLVARVPLRGRLHDAEAPAPLPPRGRVAAGVVGVACVALVATSALGGPLGVATLACGCIATIVAAASGARVLAILRGVVWQIVPLVAGLFVLARALDANGGLVAVHRFLDGAGYLPVAAGNVVVAFAVALATNVANNLPVALVAGLALHGATPPQPNVAHAALVAVDLGPNLSVTGSLATLLWLAALRRDGIAISAVHFLRAGAAVLVPALLLAALAVR